MSRADPSRAGSVIQALGVVVILIAIITGVVGPKYEVSKFDPRLRHGMGDVDWIGAQWIIVAGILFWFGIAVVIVGALFKRQQRLKTDPHNRDH